MRQKIGTIKQYDSNGRLISVRPHWVYVLSEYKTPFLDFLRENGKQIQFQWNNVEQNK